MQRSFMKPLLSLIMAFVMIFQSTASVFAKSVTLDRETTMSNYLTCKEHTDNLGAHHLEQGKRVFKIDGQYAYCIESDVGLSTDKIYEDGQSAQEILSSKENKLTTWKEKYDMISVLLSFVPTTISTNSKDEHIKWLVGQTMLWEITGEERGSHFSYVGNKRTGSTAYRDCYMWSYKADEQTFLNYYEQLEKKILSYWVVPSFMSETEGQKTITLDHYDGTYYYTTVTDTHNVLQQYDFTGTGLTLTANGQQMTIKSKTIQNSALTATLNSTFKSKAPLFWSDGNYQRTVTATSLINANFHAYANVKVGTGNLEIVKKDCFGAPIQNATFEIVSPTGQKTTHTTNSAGKIVLNAIECGKYTIHELSAPDGYILNASSFELTVYPGQTATKSVENDEPMGSIQLTKSIDTQHTEGKMGDATLAGNEYTLFAKEKITNRAGTHTYFEKDQIVAKTMTDEKGKLTFPSLHLGKYYIKETQSNESLVLNSMIYDVTLTYQDMHTSLVTQKVSTVNKVNSQKIQILKQSEKDEKALEGAEFTFVLESEFQKTGFEKAVKYFVGVTNKNGLLTTGLLPYGVYHVKETKVPEGYYSADDFLVTIDKDASTYEVGQEVKKVTVKNKPFESLLKIVKVDQETGKTVQKAGATFKIRNLDTNEYISYTAPSVTPNMPIDQWTTQADGTIILDVMLQAGHYQLEEIAAPEGYLINQEALKFEISKDDYEVSDDQKKPITIIEFANQPIKGKINLVKKGEVCVGYQDGKFIYEMRGLANVEFGIYASEDIMSSANDELVYKKGELVEKLTTNQDGKATSLLLPLGTYECKELAAPFGYILSQESQVVTLSSKEQEIVYETVTQLNERQKILVEVVKKDEDSKEYVAGAELTLIANRDIYNIDGDIIVKAGTELETIQSTKDGKISFTIDLPLDLTPELTENPEALYKVQETVAPQGYASKDMTFYVDGAYNQDKEVLTYTYDFYNAKTQIMIYKVDELKQAIAGAKLQIVDKETKEVIYEWLSGKEGYLVTGLTAGKTYILHEVSAPEGYKLSQDIEFIVKDTKDIQEVTMIDYKVPAKIEIDEPEPEVPVTNDPAALSSYIFISLGCILLFTIAKRKKD